MNCIATGNINNAINLNGSPNNYFEDIVLGETLGTSPQLELDFSSLLVMIIYLMV